MKMFVFAMIVLMAVLMFFAAGCGMLERPYVGNAGYVLINQPDSKATAVIGSNNTQANAIHSPLGEAARGEDGQQKAQENAEGKSAVGGGLFVNNNVGDRSADIDATSSLEKLSKVSESNVSQNTGRDQSPASSSTTSTSSKQKTTEVDVSTPVSVSQAGASSTVGAKGVKEAAESKDAAEKAGGIVEKAKDAVEEAVKSE